MIEFPGRNSLYISSFINRILSTVNCRFWRHSFEFTMPIPSDRVQFERSVRTFIEIFYEQRIDAGQRLGFAVFSFRRRPLYRLVRTALSDACCRCRIHLLQPRTRPPTPLLLFCPKPLLYCSLQNRLECVRFLLSSTHANAGAQGTVLTRHRSRH